MYVCIVCVCVSVCVCVCEERKRKANCSQSEGLDAVTPFESELLALLYENLYPNVNADIFVEALVSCFLLVFPNFPFPKKKTKEEEDEKMEKRTKKEKKDKKDKTKNKK